MPTLSKKLINYQIPRGGNQFARGGKCPPPPKRNPARTCTCIYKCTRTCIHVHTRTCTCTCIYTLTCTFFTCIYISVYDKLIWRTIGPKNFLFGTAQFSLWASGTVNYGYIVSNSINS